MKARMLTRVLGVILPAALILTSPVFAHDHYYSGGHVDHNYSYGGHVDHGYGTSRYVDPGYAYGGYRDYGYARPPYYGNGSAYGSYDHPSGALGYWGKDARHHYNRGHQHHHWF